MLGKYPHQLSGGQQQRLLIARALLLDVKLLVADEIISMLDASTRVDVLNLLVKPEAVRAWRSCSSPTTCRSATTVSDRTIILRHGAIVEMGDTEKVFGNPQHHYTKMLLAAVPELHKKWQHTPLGPVAVSGNGQAAAADTIESSPNGRGVTALAHATMVDEMTHGSGWSSATGVGSPASSADRGSPVAIPRSRSAWSRPPCPSSNRTTW